MSYLTFNRHLTAMTDNADLTLDALVAHEALMETDLENLGDVEEPEELGQFGKHTNNVRRKTEKGYVTARASTKRAKVLYSVEGTLRITEVLYVVRKDNLKNKTDCIGNDRDVRDFLKTPAAVKLLTDKQLWKEYEANDTGLQSICARIERELESLIVLKRAIIRIVIQRLYKKPKFANITHGNMIKMSSKLLDVMNYEDRQYGREMFADIVANPIRKEFVALKSFSVSGTLSYSNFLNKESFFRKFEDKFSFPSNHISDILTPEFRKSYAIQY